ncbi:beta strand repeat-containing protein [Sodalinema gerasimenkoae]|uniref:beta strand repeat-containing protein n=1 Tax=Sodalinema gerasimenkoae TaxID=2862348 RepID=UPI0013591707|nr:S-layer family protein [Sodalinema gerasimenkoae]
MKQLVGWTIPSTLNLTSSAVLLTLILATADAPGLAQIIPDTTLPENSRVTSEGSQLTIEGGTRAGTNLFHSFDHFDLPANWEAQFNNPAAVERIITRITGNQPSQIDGLLRANHQASLIFLNPNGIEFGETAQLQLGGSFIASTAEGLLFDDGSQYNAVSPSLDAPLLTVSVPVGLQFGNNPAPIRNQSLAASSLISSLDVTLTLPNAPGLTVAPGQVLGLFGGDIHLEGGNLSSFGGQIILGSFGENSQITWQLQPDTLALNRDSAVAGGTLALSQGATISSSGLGGGAIDLYGDRIQLEEGASLRADTFGPINGQGMTITAQDVQMRDRAFISSSSFGSGAGGDIDIRSDRIEIQGTQPGMVLAQLINETFNPTQLQDGLYALSLGTGRGGTIRLNSREIALTQGAVIVTSTLNQGAGGNIQVDGQHLRLNDGAILLTGTARAGRAGDIRLNLDQLQVNNGGFIGTASNASGTADSGDLDITADRIILERTPAGLIVPGGLFTTTLGQGNAGDLSIQTRQLEVRQGMQISASSSSAGKGGNLRIDANESIVLADSSDDNVWLSGIFTTSSLVRPSGQQGTAGAGTLEINTQRLILNNGARISAATGGEGAAGRLTIRASESIELTGDIPSALGFRRPSALFAESLGSGEAGSLEVITPLLQVRDRAEIAVRGRGTGAAGNLEVTADRIEVFNQSEIGASTVDGAGGNLHLNFRELHLRDGGLLSVSSQGQGNAGDVELQGQYVNLNGGRIAATSILGQGGNLNLNLENAAILRGGSSLSTRAGTAATAGGDGGNINLQLGAIALLDGSSIDANAFQGAGGNIQIATQGLFLGGNSQITASSEFGVDGTVSIQTPDTEAGAGLVELTERPIDPASQIASGCAASDDNSFLVTGRGGLPEQPSESLRDTHSSWGDHRDWRSRQTTSPSEVTQQPESGSNLVEATTWVYHLDGTMALVAPRAIELGQGCP